MQKDIYILFEDAIRRTAVLLRYLITILEVVLLKILKFLLYD